MNTRGLFIVVSAGCYLSGCVCRRNSTDSCYEVLIPPRTELTIGWWEFLLLMVYPITIKMVWEKIGFFGFINPYPDQIKE